MRVKKVQKILAKSGVAFDAPDAVLRHTLMLADFSEEEIDTALVLLSAELLTPTAASTEETTEETLPEIAPVLERLEVVPPTPEIISEPVLPMSAVQLDTPTVSNTDFVTLPELVPQLEQSDSISFEPVLDSEIVEDAADFLPSTPLDTFEPAVEESSETNLKTPNAAATTPGFFSKIFSATSSAHHTEPEVEIAAEMAAAEPETPPSPKSATPQFSDEKKRRFGFSFAPQKITTHASIPSTDTLSGELPVVSPFTSPAPDRGASDRATGAHKLFRTQESLTANEIHQLLGIDVHIEAQDETAIYESSRYLSTLQLTLIWFCSAVFAIVGIMSYMYVNDVGVFHKANGVAELRKFKE